MEKEKESFIIHQDYKKLFDGLDDKQLRALIMAMFDYNETGQRPEFEDTILQISTLLLFNNMEREREKWHRIREIRSSAGKKGGRPKKAETDQDKTQKAEKAKKANAFDKKQKVSKKSKKSKCNVNVNVNDNVNVNERERDNPPPPLAPGSESAAHEAVALINTLAHTDFIVTDEITGNISEILRQGFTPEDIRAVIRKKCREWRDPLNKHDMRGNIRPSVLLNPRRFEEYLHMRTRTDPPAQSETDRGAVTDSERIERIERIKSRLEQIESEKGAAARRDDQYVLLKSQLERLEEIPRT